MTLITDPDIRDFLQESTRTGKLAVRLRPTKVIAHFNMIG